MKTESDGGRGRRNAFPWGRLVRSLGSRGAVEELLEAELERWGRTVMNGLGLAKPA